MNQKISAFICLALLSLTSISSAQEPPKVVAPAPREAAPFETTQQVKARIFFESTFKDYDQATAATEKLKELADAADLVKVEDAQLIDSLKQYEKTLTEHSNKLEATGTAAKILKMIERVENEKDHPLAGDVKKIRQVKRWLVNVMVKLEEPRIEEKDKEWVKESKGLLIAEAALPKDPAERKKAEEKRSDAESALINFIKAQHKAREEEAEKLYEKKAFSYHLLIDAVAKKHLNGEITKIRPKHLAAKESISYADLSVLGKDEKEFLATSWPKYEDVKVPVRLDLTRFYPAMQTQGDTKACAAYSIASDLSYVTKDSISPLFTYFLYLGGPGKAAIRPFTEVEHAFLLMLAESPRDVAENEIKWNPEVSENYFEYFSKSLQIKDDSPLFKKMDVGASHVEALDFFKTHGLTTEEDFSSNEMKIPNSLNEIPNRTRVVEKWVGYPAAERGTHRAFTISGHMLRTMVALKQPPIVSIATDARSISGDWLRPEMPRGSIGHVVNVVGYGVGTDPFDNERKNYFILRDSLVPNKLHYKISENELLYLIGGTYKILNAGTIKEPVKYKALEAETVEKK